MKRVLLILALVSLIGGSRAIAQTAKEAPMAKLTDSLVTLHARHSAHLAQASALAFTSDDPLVRLVEDRVVIDAAAAGDVNALKSDLESLGMQQAVSFGRIVSGQLPIANLPSVAALPSLKFAKSAAAITRAGNVTSQGDQSMGSNVARATFGVDGTGVQVGVLSDSFNCLGGAGANVSTDDLSPVNVLQEISSCTGATDEGRAMLQIVHDIAPGANLLFASAFNGEAAFASAIQNLAAAGAKVIVDDVAYFDEPFFQDGIVAQAANNVVAGGAAYFSAAGNEGRQSYQSVYRPGDSFADGAIPSGPSAPHFFGGTAHNFNSTGGKNNLQSITVTGRSTVNFFLQWDSPFFSASGSPGAQNDLDIYILNSSATQVLAGAAFNNTGGDAVEIFSFTNNSLVPVTVNLMIVKFSGADPGLIKYIWLGPATVNNFNTRSGTIVGHANAASVEAVGAARYSNTPAFGVSPPLLEGYSSSGTTAILFDVTGNRLATPDLRADKPEVVAPDGVDTTFFGSDTDGDGFPNFFGTSAAAPHAAGVAALLFQSNPLLIPINLYGSINTTAIDMGAAGFDNDTGYGLVQADAALSACTVAIAATPFGSVQAAVAVAKAGDTVSVGGSCNENVLIRNETQRVTLDGGGSATINGSSSSTPTVNVRGREILIQGFTISGGSVGIGVNRGSNAVINDNTIHNTFGSGVVIDELAFAALTNNTITNNPGAGIWVSESSTARIGFNQDTETTSSSNTIQNNGVGIIVSNRSSSRIVGNTISSNIQDGIDVLRDSQADIADNVIENNGGDGIGIAENAFVQLGEDAGTSIYELPNTSTITNAGFGIKCTTAGMADGRIGSLNGSSGAMSFSTDCLNDLSP